MEKAKLPANVSTPMSSGFLALVAEYQAKQKCSRSEAIRAMAIEHPDEHLGYLGSYNGRPISTFFKIPNGLSAAGEGER